MILGKGKQEMRGQASMYNLHNQLMHWATIAPEQISIVEAETGRSMTYSHCLSAVQKMRRFLGAQPRNLILTLSGGIADAVLWLSALTGGHMLVPLAPDAAEEERARAVNMYKPDVLFVEQPEEALGTNPSRQRRSVAASATRSGGMQGEGF